MIWNPISWWLELLKAGKFDPQPDEDERPDPPVDAIEGEITEPIDVVEPVLEPGRIRAVGAWTGWGSLVNNSAIERDLAFARKLGLGRLDVIVNDFSAKEKPTPFGTYNKSRIVAFCQAAVKQGFHVHLMTWWMPHEKFINEGTAQLINLVADCGARSVMLDVEEPWVRADSPMPWTKAAELTAEGFGAVPFGVTGIGYASVEKLGPLVRRAAYMVPQCYSTAGNTLNPKTASESLSNRWRRNFGTRELVVGLAGYRQKGRPGYTQEQFMVAAFESAGRAGPSDVVYWSLRQIRASRTTANVIGGLAQRASHHGG